MLAQRLDNGQTLSRLCGDTYGRVLEDLQRHFVSVLHELLLHPVVYHEVHGQEAIELIGGPTSGVELLPAGPTLARSTTSDLLAVLSNLAGVRPQSRERDHHMLPCTLLVRSRAEPAI